MSCTDSTGGCHENLGRCKFRVRLVSERGQASLATFKTAEVAAGEDDELTSTERERLIQGLMQSVPKRRAHLLPSGERCCGEIFQKDGREFCEFPCCGDVTGRTVINRGDSDEWQTIR